MMSGTTVRVCDKVGGGDAGGFAVGRSMVALLTGIFYPLEEDYICVCRARDFLAGGRR